MHRCYVKGDEIKFSPDLCYLVKIWQFLRIWWILWLCLKRAITSDVTKLHII